MLENIVTDPITNIAGATVGLAWLGRILWRRWSKDTTEVAKDRAEVNILDTMQEQLKKLTEENNVLRSREVDLATRLGRLEAKEAEAARHLEMINRLQERLNEKDDRIERLIKEHSEETGAMRVLLKLKDDEIKNLHDRLEELEERLRRDEKFIKCPHCKKGVGQ